MEGAVLGVTALAMALADGMSDDNVGVLGALFTQLGDTLTSISVIRALEAGKKPAANPPSATPSATAASPAPSANDESTTAESPTTPPASKPDAPYS